MMFTNGFKLLSCRTILMKRLALKLPSEHHSLCLESLISSRLCSSSYFKEKDNFKETIYVGELTLPMKSVKLFSLLTSVSGILAQPFIIERANEIGSNAVLVASYGFIGFFSFVTPLLLHLVTKKYVTEITYDSQMKNYTASTIGLFLQRKSLTFTPDDVTVPEISAVFTTFYAKKVPLFVEPSIFKDISHYGKIMGYDKPLDLKLGRTKSSDVQK